MMLRNQYLKKRRLLEDDQISSEEDRPAVTAKRKFTDEETLDLDLDLDSESSDDPDPDDDDGTDIKDDSEDDEEVKDAEEDEGSEDDEEVKDAEEDEGSEDDEEVKDADEDSESEDKGTSDQDQDVDSGVSGEEDELLDQDEESQRTEIRKELANLTFEELEALKVKMGTKMYNEAMFGSSKSKVSDKKRKKLQQQIFKRDNKNRPRELPSRIHVEKVRKVVHVPTKRVRDPRFENLCGDLDEKIWKNNYSFLTDLAKEEESTLRDRLKSDDLDDEEKSRIRKYLQKLSNKTRSDEQKEKLDQKRRTEKEENVQRMKEGKRPYYMKKSTRKYVELSEKYDELKASGKLESYLRKKRKKNAIRDKKSVKLQRLDV